ncbi:Rossmann-fold NAD(P)-binding domain-containing protein [Cohnella cholangitidis]|uniref:NAD-dependent epimerase/dehydratase family protein n=1 Tax=Cohnella cholangitidis TaxID=2598458 RepID=A0A7G5BZC5_9BACL|nr:NAD-dependent epimerase/dehydratase family protein [Cohnella cholangitidis]QMV42309.1 NAD-dependent epimerase/dehydratase family protein [Cohnella cholangitidis]
MAAPSKTAIVAGSTGLIGSCLLRRLLEDSRYERVIALTRKALPVSHPKLDAVAISLDSLPTVAPSLQADDWFCALGTTIRKAGSQEAFRRVDYDYPLALGKQAAASRAKQCLLVSAIGASAASSIFYSRVKGEVERDLSALGIPKLHLFRPSLLLGDRAEYGRGEKFMGVLMKGLNPFLLGSLRKYRSIQADQVAAAMIRAANLSSDPGVHIYEGKQLRG